MSDAASDADLVRFSRLPTKLPCLSSFSSGVTCVVAPSVRRAIYRCAHWLCTQTCIHDAAQASCLCATVGTSLHIKDVFVTCAFGRFCVCQHFSSQSADCVNLPNSAACARSPRHTALFAIKIQGGCIIEALLCHAVVAQRHHFTTSNTVWYRSQDSQDGFQAVC